jgi:hypothetical protein
MPEDKVPGFIKDENTDEPLGTKGNNARRNYEKQSQELHLAQ